ncbi:MAG TPA: VacJ family lipoprotein [Hyphomonadaceae bacterium]|nr:VacJ family lipoprotein [Hyphomonadaceae bacterium]HPN05763.1 VacJ family lipoprotein [Hyphomonadaceae bacterium]
MTIRSVSLTGAASVLAALSLSGCLTAGPNPEDPYEDFNRQMFAFNDGLDRAVLEPVAKGYRAVTNEPIREGVGNFGDNLNEPLTFVNHVLQGQIPDAGATFGRFVINTTVGIGGIFDPASAMGMQRTKEDFGQTLGKWGVQGGPYIVLPFLGPTNPRDIFGMGGDVALNPLNYPEFESDDEIRMGIGVLGGINGRAGAIEAINEVRNQIDPYTTVRRFYDRTRAQDIANAPIQPNETEKLPESELDF